MIRNARHSIERTMAERYLPLLEGINLKKIDPKLTILSEDSGLKSTLKVKFPEPNHAITVFPIKKSWTGFPTSRVSMTERGSSGLKISGN
jgi:hypothetical protein